MYTTEQWFPFVLLYLAMPYYADGPSTRVYRWRKQLIDIQMKGTEQYFPVVLFIMLYKVVLSFEYVDEILKCDHSNESYWAALSCGAFYYTVQDGSKFWVCGWNLKCDHEIKATEEYFPVVLLTMLYKMVLAFPSVQLLTIQIPVCHL